MCVCGEPLSLGVVYGLVAATFLHSAASEQHIPGRGSWSWKERKSGRERGERRQREIEMVGGTVKEDGQG